MKSVSFILLLLLSTVASASENTTIDRVFEKSGDVTGDGVPEKINIHITAASIMAPFTWNVTITNMSGSIIFKAERNDAWLNDFFNDQGYMQNCAGYKACKELYYFTYIPEAIFKSITPSDSEWQMNDFMLTNMQQSANNFMTQNGLTDSDKIIAINEMRGILGAPGYHSLQLPFSAVQSDSPLIWVPSCHMFIPYYAP